MTITTTVEEHIAVARRFEVENRWAMVARAYEGALDAGGHAMLRSDRTLLEHLMRASIDRSHEMETVTATVSQAAIDEFDRRGQRMARARARMNARNPYL